MSGAHLGSLQHLPLVEDLHGEHLVRVSHFHNRNLQREERGVLVRRHREPCNNHMLRRAVVALIIYSDVMEPKFHISYLASFFPPQQAEDGRQELVRNGPYMRWM